MVPPTLLKFKIENHSASLLTFLFSSLLSSLLRSLSNCRTPLGPLDPTGTPPSYASYRSQKISRWIMNWKVYWQARGQSPIQIPNPRTWAVTKILWAITPHGSDRSLKYPWVSGRYPKSRWTVQEEHYQGNFKWSKCSKWTTKMCLCDRESPVGNPLHNSKFKFRACPYRPHRSSLLLLIIMICFLASVQAYIEMMRSFRTALLVNSDITDCNTKN